MIPTLPKLGAVLVKLSQSPDESERRLNFFVRSAPEYPRLMALHQGDEDKVLEEMDRRSRSSLKAGALGGALGATGGALLTRALPKPARDVVGYAIPTIAGGVGGTLGGMSLADKYHNWKDERALSKTARDYSKDLKEHFRDPHWPSFEKNLRSKDFQKQVMSHPKADAKLKRYVTNYGGHLVSKDVVGVVPSRTKNKAHKIKKLKSGRLSCSCRDWQYFHSVRNSDCAHISELKQGIEKKSENPLSSLARGIAASRSVSKAQKEWVHGNVAQENQRRLYAGQPLVLPPKFGIL